MSSSSFFFFDRAYRDCLIMSFGLMVSCVFLSGFKGKAGLSVLDKSEVGPFVPGSKGCREKP